jgi:alginate O-acetyltransferase complex protein AlgI
VRIRRMLDVSKQAARRYLIAGIVFNLGLLAWFKYLGFLEQNIDALLQLTGTSHLLRVSQIALPLGISFFAFQGISYLIDIYRGTIQGTSSLFAFATYKSMFPQLIAGPIVRYADIAAELGNREADPDAVFIGITRFIRGLAKKVLIADTLSATADAVFALSPHELSFGTAWLGVAAYTLQIYFDFSGYSDMAIGMGRMMGFKYPENFNHPYISRSIGEFWRRWHMTLSAWFRDYLYFPLGGNRVGWARAAINLVIVMFVGGLWHGAAWTFVVWGLLHGSYLVIEHTLRAVIGEKAWADKLAVKVVLGLITYAAVCVAWVFFRASDFATATRILRGMFGGHPHGDAILATREMLQIGIVTFFMMLAHWSLRDISIEQAVERLPRWLVIAVWTVMACAIILNQGSSNAFIYFQF